ncbi:MAG TPA: response regulator [Burkholderiales bacterium]|nr:response regulator [Burkholderiales bacterium]
MARILIIDDEESTRLLLASILEKALGAEIQLAGTSVQALKLVQSVDYDAILLDLMMPGMDGYELLRRIRAGTLNAAAPLVVVSVLAEASARERALALGANAYHVKPVRRDELLATVRALVDRRA